MDEVVAAIAREWVGLVDGALMEGGGSGGGPPAVKKLELMSCTPSGFGEGQDDGCGGGSEAEGGLLAGNGRCRGTSRLDLSYGDSVDLDLKAGWRRPMSRTCWGWW